MGQYELRKQGLELLKKIDTKREQFIIIHYACDNFKNSSTISAIAIRQFKDGQTESYSLDKTAQIMGIDKNEIKENLSEIETKMLTDFFNYVELHKEDNWIHWNMNGDTYGFKAIEHRFEVLEKSPTKLSDKNKINLSNLFIELYDKGFAKHPRIENLMEMNYINPNDFFPGYNSNADVTDEIDLLNSGRYKEIQISCARKVDIFSNFLNLAIDDSLKVKTPKIKRYGTTFKGKLAALNETIWFKPLTYLVTLFIGYMIEKFFDFILK